MSIFFLLTIKKSFGHFFQRSISPKTTSSVPMMATMSANIKFLPMWSRSARWAKPGALILHLQRQNQAFISCPLGGRTGTAKRKCSRFQPDHLGLESGSRHSKLRPTKGSPRWVLLKYLSVLL